MSIRVIREALEDALAAMPGALPSALQNTEFKPVTGKPYQEVFWLAAATQAPTLGDRLKREPGIFQVTLCYPKGTGTTAAETKADEIRLRFKRGTAFTVNGIRILIDKHPSISTGRNDPAWYRLPVSIPFFADVFTPA